MFTPTIYLLLIMENGYIPTSQGGLEIKYLLQGGMSGKESLLVQKLLRINRYFIIIENSALCYLSELVHVETCSHPRI